LKLKVAEAQEGEDKLDKRVDLVEVADKIQHRELPV
jgi:hypothetical protein